ncbi:MAG: DUF116 domain-containing protein [Lentisphaerae bacterium]|nr:DUF116 domain-containing protein [Lentisphaerota bacterium]
MSGAPQTLSGRAATDAPDLRYGEAAGRTARGPVTVPGEASERERLAAATDACLRGQALVPPLVMPELRRHADAVIAATGCDPAFREYLYVLINNAAWRPVVAAVPYERRTLLLPPCLRASGKCPARFDKLGLLCERCGSCEICALSDEAEALGYTVLVAEGTGVVADLVSRGVADAAIGVSCMPALERAFPHMVTGAVPGLAVPLLTDGCRDTRPDTAPIREAVRLRAPGADWRPLDLAKTREAVNAWFQEAQLRRFPGIARTQIGAIAGEWLARAGKRWRPFLTTAVYTALSGADVAALPDHVRHAALAVECIHKASLIYDDVQDNDAVRYGLPAVHAAHGTPLALTVSLYLLGLGYRLLADAPAPAAMRAAMLSLAADGHCRLCHGQGAELAWVRAPGPLGVEQVLDFFARKTAPSFDVVFRLGALCAGADPEVHDVLRRYSEALGVAYQIRDDLEDFTEDGDADDIRMQRPSIVLAVAAAHAAPSERDVIAAAWGRGLDAHKAAAIRGIIAARDVERKTRDLLGDYKQRALDALAPLRNGDLKMALCRVVGKVLGP